MQRRLFTTIALDNFAISKQLKSCASLRQGKEIHQQLRKLGPEAEAILGNALFDMYLRVGSAADAGEIFFQMLTRDIFSWTRLIGRYVHQGCFNEAITLLHKMQLHGFRPDKVTFVSALGAFTDLPRVKNLHSCIAESGEDESNVVVGNSLISSYFRCRSPSDAWRVFEKLREPDLVSWTAMITGYAQLGLDSEAIHLFKLMQLDGVKPDAVTFITILNACSKTSGLPEAKRVEACARESGLDQDVVVANSILEVHSKSGNLEEVIESFESMRARSIVSWNTVMSAYAQKGGPEVFHHLNRMQLEGVPLDKFSLVTGLDACANLTLLAEGRRMHRFVLEKGVEGDIVVGNALVNMYGKCGSLRNALRVFDRMGDRDLVSWTSITDACAQHGDAELGLKLFLVMQQEGVKPDRVAVSSVLHACSHVGLVERGCQCFGSLVSDYGMSPGADQHLVIVDLLGRAGRLESAEKLISKMEESDPEGTRLMWMNLLSACKLHRDPDRGKRAGERVISLDRQYTPAYVILSSIYSAAGKWVEAAKIRRRMRENGAAKKERGHSWIHVKNRVHLFVERDQSHPQREMIYSELERIHGVMRGAGYVPDKDWVIQDVDEEQKERMLSFHSEKLAVAFGILSTPARSELLIIKNLRVCGDCHTALKWISKIEGRHLVVRDAHRFHHFDGGKCSCGDYW